MSKEDGRPMSESDFIAKIEWEGGVVGALEYGLTSNDVEPGELQNAWKELEKAWVPMQDAIEEVQSLIDDM